MRLVGQIVTALQLWCIHRTTQRLHPGWSGCYDTRAAPGSSVCREARDGACVGHMEEDKTDRTSAKIGATTTEETPTCEAVTDSNAVSKKCAQNKCDVTIGGNPYCSQCSTTSEAPVDGVCTATTSTACEGSVTTGLCTQCKSGYFLFQGGCYQIGQSPGSLICADTKASGTTGTCKACAEGYFTVSGATATVDSCVACGDENCATCTVGAEQQKCSKCKTTGTKTYLKGDAGAGTCVTEAECTANNDHYIDNTDSGPNGKTCKACSTIAGCSTCSSGTACTKCTDENYLKMVSGVTTCVTDCGEGYFKHTATDSSLKTCQSCSGANSDLTPAAAGVAGCAACTYDSAKVTCTKCETGKYLKSDGTCADNCTANTEFVKNDPTNGNKCVSCSDNNNGGIADCAECSLLPSASRPSATLIKCTKCGNSKYLKEGTCVDKAECTGTTFPKEDNSNGNKCVPCNDSTNGGVADCTACALTTDSSRTTLVTCSACSGNKIVKTADGATSCIDESACNNGFFVKESGGSKTCEACDSTCKTCSGVAAQCTSCNANKPYLKKTENSQTGTCVDAAGCTNGNTYYADDADPRTCKACAEGTFEGCETCEKSTDGAVACKTCGPQKKIRPDKKGCIDACPPDVSTEKSGVCECVEGYTLEGGNCASSSANKSGLSTGAIVGISVAAVVACSVPLTGYLPLQNEQSKQSYYC
ncbi:Variant-specific surface protein [Giardia duodenalis]|uniref:Variant-specific surface protein n=1 Tax=Giardia intestinalis TaxID=5741 RepID=V6TP60_GIAIN|nr:Variant-specific surface protein [Giardia intestinalis]